ncbi:hypothetical protein AQJ91_14290 [Streptomyces dysideae]|uniref:DUF5753 domain-containing protein n=1 Tax=Streptomyces dysideae TaxID=909626 RepID=A0A101V0V4_9ACTN|nr:hypothetical protein AQJ91_14290 [Streptomyces dysideae]
MRFPAATSPWRNRRPRLLVGAPHPGPQHLLPGRGPQHIRRTVPLSTAPDGPHLHLADHMSHDLADTSQHRTTGGRPATVAQLRLTFELLAASALSPQKSLALIEALAQDYAHEELP